MSAGYPMLELQILSINVVCLTSNFVNWSLFKWDQQLEKIWNLSISQSDVVKDIDWLKKTLSWIVTARYILNRILFFAYLANISTLLIRKYQDLLIFWMVLSFFKDIVLEISVIITTFLLWYEINIPTPLLIEFITEKTIWLGVSIYKWYTTLKWYMQLRRAAKYRNFALILQRSIASIVPAPGRNSYSLEDVCLSSLITKRSIYSDLRTTKSLTTLISDTSDTDDDSFVNELSLAEKSMKILNVTAEDVMDARARIQERNYWNEQNVPKKKSENLKEIINQYPLKKNEKKMDASTTKQSTDHANDVMDYTLKKEDILQYPLIAKELKKENNNTPLDFEKCKVSTKKQKEEIPLTEMEKDTSNEEENYTKSSNPCESCIASKIKDKESITKFANIMQCFSSNNVRDIKNKLCASLMKLKIKLELEEKRCCIPINTKEEFKAVQVGQILKKEHLYEDKTKLMLTDLSKHKKESISKKPETSSRHQKENIRSIDNNNNEVINHDVDEIKFISFTSDIKSTNVSRKFHKHNFTFMCSKKDSKQAQKFERFSKKNKTLVTWGSMSLAQTAHPSGYERNAAAVNKSPDFQKYIQTEVSEDSQCCNIATIRRHRLRHKVQDGQSVHSVYNVTSFKTNSYAQQEMKSETVKNTKDRILLENKKNAKAPTRGKEKKHNFSHNCISTEDRKAVELRALKAYNKLTLLKDKEELEMRKKRESSLINVQSIKKLKSSEIFFQPFNDLTLMKDGKEMETIGGRNLLLNRKAESSEEANALTIHNELLEDRRERESVTKYNLSEHETSAMSEEKAETPTSTSDHSSEVIYEEPTISSAETQIRNINFETNGRGTRCAHMSLNLREITRNIEWTLHPTSRGIILTNKNLYCQYLENGRFRENQQRDIVDDNTASTLHGAFFSKQHSEITRIFRAAQIRISESSFPNLSTFWREDFNSEFVCQVRNEMAMRYQDSLVDFNLEPLSDSVNNNCVASQENNRDLCMIFIDREQIGSESDTAITEDSATESWGDARSNVHMTSATNDNLPLQFIVNELRNFGAEVSERNVRIASSIEHVQECGNIDNRILDDDFGINKHITDNIRFNEDDNNKVLSDQNANIDNMFDDRNEGVLNMSNSSHKNVSSVDSSISLHKPQDEQFLSAIDIHFKNKVYENDTSLENGDSNDDNVLTLQLPNYNNDYREFGTFINTASNCFLQNSSQSLSGPSLFHSANYRALKSSDEKLQKLTQLSDNEATLENQEKLKWILNKTNDNAISHFKKIEIFQLKTIKQGNAKNNNDEDDNMYEMATNFTTNQFSKMNSNEQLQQNSYDSYDTTYERSNSNSEIPISLEEGSLMEEFSNDSASLRMA